MKVSLLLPLLVWNIPLSFLLLSCFIALVDAKCIVNPSDCSYELHVEQQQQQQGSGDTAAVIFQGAPIYLLEESHWRPFRNCSVTTTMEMSAKDGKGLHDGTLDGSPVRTLQSWELVLDNLVTITIRNTRHDICIMAFKIERDVLVGPNDAHVALTFPAFLEEPGSSNEGRLSWSGSFAQAQDGTCSSGTEGGPCVLYDNDDPTHGAAVVLSPLDNFLHTATATDTIDASAQSIPLVWGASVSSAISLLPAGYTHSFVAVTGVDGITDTMNKWGAVLRDKYAPLSEHRLPQGQKQQQRRSYDISIETLGYQTDNGAQYCFCPHDCDTVLLEELASLRDLGVPVRYLSFQNAWWPSSHSANWCVSEWDSSVTSKIPMGVPEFQRRADLPFQLYAPYFCTDSAYAERFDFMESNTSLPGCDGFDFLEVSPEDSAGFYKWFLGMAKDSYGMVSYEIDFVNQNLNCVDRFRTEVGAAEIWMDGMAMTAEQLGISVQSCYATPFSLMQALEYPAVTNARGSFDYYYGGSWDIGLSSLLMWALDIAPSTDTFWTTDNGDEATTMGACSETCPEDHEDPGCELHTLLAVMSTGPVGFSDAINHTNVQRIMRTCRSDGVLLQPSKPLTSFDSHHFKPWRLMQSYSGPNNEKVWAYYIVGHMLSQVPADKVISVGLGELWPRPRQNSMFFLVWNRDNHACFANGARASDCGKYITAEDHLQVPPMANDYQPILATVVTTCPNAGLAAVLGELSKHASHATDRFDAIECLVDGSVRVEVSGALGETITISAVIDGAINVQTLEVKEELIATITFPRLKRPLAQSTVQAQ